MQELQSREKKPKETKHIATVSLGVMGAGFLATLPFAPHTAGAFLQSGFEAGLVGGLADWFAVTALFRHPLGIKIPHTALLPNNRAQMTKAVVSAVEDNLLGKESIALRIGQMRLVETMLVKAEEALRSEGAREAVRSACRFALERLPAEQIAAFASQQIRQAAGKMDPAAAVGLAVDQVLSHGYEEPAIDFLIDRAERWAVRAETRRLLGEIAEGVIQGIEMNGLMAFAKNALLGFMSGDKLGGMLQHALLDNLAALRLPGHRNRVGLLDIVRREMAGLKDNERLHEAVGNLARQLPDRLRLEERLTAMIESWRDRLLEQLQEGPLLDETVMPLLEEGVRRLRGDENTVRKLEEWLKAQITEFVERNHSKIGALVRENIDKMDNATLIEFIENKVGKDLQWIRVNGAVCGFIIGLALEGVRMLFGQ
ncbi:DUF445 domain-containing protein [Paenibacillus chitinolyticus]|uniref:DUF445 domain-containing protein n=1 Tax=Paenibacillus chitinolyticus TaxID=79263 RepID=A0A410WPH8_9BACL|nr:DUF445 domain-containing protein [Paenibacillus chitinolyticus]MCY9590782.1 DUF445 domain-containing protein [Paenibacillus chitinolyticus]MCY9598689.1 DUF445 domain-containing protein [Paenibacillus chitinolyticus]QAV16230.1 DUF445 domain-containing protein [Paenibacillus chitinolyticus]